MKARMFIFPLSVVQSGPIISQKILWNGWLTGLNSWIGALGFLIAIAHENTIPDILHHTPWIFNKQQTISRQHACFYYPSLQEWIDLFLKLGKQRMKNGVLPSELRSAIYQLNAMSKGRSSLKVSYVFDKSIFEFFHKNVNISIKKFSIRLVRSNFYFYLQLPLHYYLHKLSCKSLKKDSFTWIIVTLVGFKKSIPNIDW